jgi:hypothetical protein
VADVDVSWPELKIQFHRWSAAIRFHRRVVNPADAPLSSRQSAGFQIVEVLFRHRFIPGGMRLALIMLKVRALVANRGCTLSGDQAGDTDGSAYTAVRQLYGDGNPGRAKALTDAQLSKLARLNDCSQALEARAELARRRNRARSRMFYWLAPLLAGLGSIAAFAAIVLAWQIQA